MSTVPKQLSERKPRNWRAKALRPEPYDPLQLENLGRSVENKMLEMSPEPLGNVPLMMGAGIYAIYYAGDHELYRPISDVNCRIPIYVGKATAEGGRKGNEVLDPDGEADLWDRLREHRKSIEQAQDLNVGDFMVRYLVAVDFFVSLAERVMIRHFQPVWNTVVDGFGNHDPGSGRKDQKRSPWDELHPGRKWAVKFEKPSQVTALESKVKVAHHWHRLGLAEDPETLSGQFYLE